MIRTTARIFVVACVTFTAISLLSFFVLTDGHGTVRVYDGMTRIGWPLLMYEKGGMYYHESFYPNAVLVNFAAAALLAVTFEWARKELKAQP